MLIVLLTAVGKDSRLMPMMLAVAVLVGNWLAADVDDARDSSPGGKKEAR